MSDPKSAPIAGAAKKATHVSKTFLATVISLLTTAFGVVVALAWNSALTAFFTDTFNAGTAITALFVYAIIITCVGVAVIVALGRMASRLDVEPVQFAYPTPKATSKDGE
jgi:uncharacterized membrane protein